MILNAEQARAIRNADFVCFDYDGEASQIRAITRKPNEAERTFTINGIEARVNAYDGRKVTDAFDMIMSAQHVPEWRTICRRLKTGADIALHWTRGNSSPVLDSAGLVRDELRIIVNGETYKVRDYVGRDNSARMVRAR